MTLFFMSSNVKARGTDTGGGGGGGCGFRKHSPTSKLFRVLFMLSEQNNKKVDQFRSDESLLSVEILQIDYFVNLLPGSCY